MPDSTGRTSSGSFEAWPERAVAELVRHAVFAHRDLDLHARIVDIADHFGHAAERLRMTAREIGEIHRDHLPHLRLLRRSA